MTDGGAGATDSPERQAAVRKLNAKIQKLMEMIREEQQQKEGEWGVGGGAGSGGVGVEIGRGGDRGAGGMGIGSPSGVEVDVILLKNDQCKN